MRNEFDTLVQEVTGRLIPIIVPIYVPILIRKISIITTFSRMLTLLIRKHNIKSRNGFNIQDKEKVMTGDDDTDNILNTFFSNIMKNF